MRKIMLLLVLSLMVNPTITNATVTDYLILGDIGSYKLFTGIQGRVFSGPPSKYSQTATGGILDAAGHFSEGDTSYEASYTEIGGSWPFVKVQVTQHAGSDSDKWLLHEVESSFRGREKEGWLGQSLYESASIRVIDGNKIFDYGNVDYRWISNNVVVYIHYTDLTGTKPEPLEIVQAYLRKFPSTITITDTEIKSREQNEKWIKDEMERRLWLGDKWFMALQLGKAKLDKVLRESVNHMNIFLDYRENYYGISARKEKGVLWEYLQAKNGTGIKNKLAEYKSWWEANKDKPINL